MKCIRSGQQPIRIAMPYANSYFTIRCSDWFILDSATESLSKHCGHTGMYGSPGGTFLLITYYLLLITYHLLLITYYLSLITYYLLLIISFITPITAGNSKYTFPVTAVALVVVVVVVVPVYL